MQFKILVKHLIPAPLIKALMPILILARAKKRGFQLKRRGEQLDIINGSKVIRLSLDHGIYGKDIIESFDYYYDAVLPIRYCGMELVDYSTPRYHDVRGYENCPILFPSLAEPLVTTYQYIEFASLTEGMVVLDLGAYSGLTSIIFSQAVGVTGVVVAIEADPLNNECIQRNISRFLKAKQNKIYILSGAVWNHNEGIEFSCEGNMGSSATGIVGKNRGTTRLVPSFTLSKILQTFNLTRVDFIKCDVEGAEKVIFEDMDFFRRFSPKIIIEPHIVDGIETTEATIGQLAKWGYRCEKILQHGVSLPLIQASPTMMA